MGIVVFADLLLGVVFMLYGLDTSNVQATTCTKQTNFNCPVTHFSNGTCLANGQCACTEGYSAGVYGCQKDLVGPYIRMTDDEALPVGTGILALLSMTCEPVNSGATYTWRRDGVVLAQSGATLTHSEVRTVPMETIRYSCQYSVNGRDSPESEVFELMVFARMEDIDPDEDRFKPTVRGIPNTLVEGVQLRLACVHYIYYQVQRVEWSLPNGHYNGMEMGLTITNGRDNRNVSCTVVYSRDIPIKSPEMRIPKLSGNIPRVVITEGDRFVESGQPFNLTCSFVEEDFVTQGITIIWGWSHRGVPMSSFTTQSMTTESAQKEAHEGQWRCSAIFGSNAKRESPPVHVYVDMPVTVKTTVTPSRAIQGGIQAIECQANSPVPSNLSYHWQLNGEVLTDYFDDTIYINFADDNSSTLVGDFICTASVDQTTATSDTVTVLAPIKFSETPAPTLEVKGNPQEFLYGESYPLQCLFSEDFAIPGIQFEYFQNGFKLDNFPLVFTETGPHVLMCRAVFNGLPAAESEGIQVLVQGGPDSTLSSSLISTLNSNPDASENESVSETSNEGSTPPNPHETMSNSTHLLHIEAFDNNTNITSPTNSTDPSVRLDGMLNPRSNSTVTTDTESTVTRMQVGGGREQVLSSHEGQPTLSVLGNSVTSSFRFNEVYHLWCHLYDEKSQDGIRYDFYQGDVALQRNQSDVYTILNDVINKVYTCRAVSSNMSSPMSNAVAVSFDVFDEVWITWKESDVTTCSAKVTLSCEVHLLPGVPDRVNYTWYGQEMDILDKSRTLTFAVTQGFLSTYHCKAQVGSHSKTASLTIMVRGTDEHCSASSLSTGWSLVLIATTWILSVHWN